MVIAMHAGPEAMSSWTSHSSRVPGQRDRRKAATPSTAIIHRLSSQLPIGSTPRKLLIFLFKSCYVAQADFTLTILLHQPPEQQDYRCELWRPAWGTFLIPLDLYAKVHFSQCRMLPSRLTSTPCPRGPIQPLCDQSQQPRMSGSLTSMLHHILKSHDTWTLKSFFLQKFRISAYKSASLFEMLEWAY